ncbi:hypothetical protein SESBI_00415 [Sesbania bispinosa]|nr:hypothetical protein SESBI_00415 [Sesbania bispinosa]
MRKWNRAIEATIAPATGKGLEHQTGTVAGEFSGGGTPPLIETLENEVFGITNGVQSKGMWDQRYSAGLRRVAIFATVISSVHVSLFPSPVCRLGYLDRQNACMVWHDNGDHSNW